jgi:hypothetical protein
MRRTGAVLMIVVSALAGCGGSQAQERYGHVMAAGQDRPTLSASAPASDTEPIAAEASVPWAIALVSDAPKPPAKRSGKVVVVDAGEDQPFAAEHEVDFYVTADPEPSDVRLVEEKPVAPKSCSGVVNRRS